MSEKETIEVKIDKDGKVTIDAIGFKGRNCTNATDGIERALGVIKSRDKKPEYNQDNLEELNLRR